MAAILFSLPLVGSPTGEGYQLSFFAAGTSSPQAVFHDSNLGSAWLQPIVFNADGMPDGPIYLSPTPALKVVYVDEHDVPVSGYPVDNVSPAEVAS